MCMVRLVRSTDLVIRSAQVVVRLSGLLYFVPILLVLYNHTE